MKKCAKCQQHKAQSDFHKDKSKKDGLMIMCKPCNKAKRYEWVKNNPDKVKAYSRLRYQIVKSDGRYKKMKSTNTEARARYKRKERYGLTNEDFQLMMFAQTGKCAICNNKLIRPHVDHCHKTNVVRGILCVHCNRGLGEFFDNTDLLLKAIIYLQNQAKKLAKEKANVA